ncbi:MAG TPA: glycoside hydrolase family 18 protein [bacterium]|nr:glycoside hydrolase family 18 protein [bacterium]
MHNRLSWMMLVFILTGMSLGCEGKMGKADRTPRLVAYYNANTVPVLAKADTFPYTHYILAYLLPDGTGGVKPEGALKYTLKDPAAIRRVQSAGKKVLISLGGGTVAGEAWLEMGKNADKIARETARYVEMFQLDGVDLDIENVGYKTEKDLQTYGEAIIRLTLALARELPGKLLTHAPQPPYLCKPRSFSQCPDVSLYAYVLASAGSHISWLNMQYYSNPPLTVSDAQEVSHYESVVNGWEGFPGLEPRKLVVGKPYSRVVSGHEPRERVISMILQPLASEYQNSFGGFMGWEFSEDSGGAWAQAVSKVLR